MRVDLVELLRVRAIRHPSRITLLESRCHSDLRIEVTGYPWWLEDPPRDRDQRITFHLEGITGGVLDSDLIDADSCDEDLLAFDARPLSEQAWAKGIEYAVYCSRPLPNALEIYASLHDFLLSVDCPFPPAHYLNMGNSRSFNELVAIAAAASFLLCRGPEAVCGAVCEALQRSGAAFSVIRGQDLARDLVYVRLLGSHWICESAYAVFDDRR